MTIPVKITPCPIVEAIVEIKFDYDVDLDPDAIFGIVYKALHDKFPKTAKLPILQLPEAIRLHDPNLISQPHYKLTNDKFLFQIGPKVMSLNNVKGYVGWEIFYKKLIDTFSLIAELKIINKVTRLGIRYINFFEGMNILDNVNLNIKLEENNFKDINTFLRAEVPSGDYISILQVGNRMSIEPNKKQLNGSVIDIDTSVAGDFEDFFSKLPDLLKKGHEEEKRLFFSLLTDDFLKSLNPEY